MGMTAAQPSSPLFGKVYGGVFFGGAMKYYLISHFMATLCHFVTKLASVSIASRWVSYATEAARKMEENFWAYTPIFLGVAMKWKLLIRFFSVSYDK